MDEGFKNLVDYARGGAPGVAGNTSRPVPREQADIIPLVPPKEPSLQDEILQMLEELAAGIRSGKVSPSHLIMGWGERIEVGGEPASSFVWDTTGLTRFELIGHLHTYATKLAIGEGE